jgi:hypothetical protein
LDGCGIYGRWVFRALTPEVQRLQQALCRYRRLGYERYAGDSQTERVLTAISNNVAKWIDQNFSLLEVLVANSIWCSHLKNLWRILCESCPPSGTGFLRD